MARGWPLALWALFVVAAIVRAAVVVELRDLPSARYLVADARYYDDAAAELVARRGLPGEPFPQAPLYPYFLAAVYSLCGHSPGAVRWLQVLLGALTVVCIAQLARRAFGRRAGLAAGGLAAFYGPLVFFTGVLLKETLAVFFLALGMLLLVTQTGRPPTRSGAYLAAGVAFAAAALLRENLLLLLPAVGLFVLVPVAARPGRREATRLAALALGALLAAAPFAVLNRAAGGPLTPSSPLAGLNFYIGNSRVASGTFVPLAPGDQSMRQMLEWGRELAATLIERSRGHPIEPAELDDHTVSRALVAETLAHVAAEPFRWLRLLARKLRLFWNGYEIPDAEAYVVHRRLSLALSWLAPLDFRVVAPLGMVGLVLGLRRSPRPGLLLFLATSAILVSVVAFFVLGRHRLPVLVPLLPAAGLTVAELARSVALRRWRPLTALGASILVAGAFVWPPAFAAAERYRHESTVYFNLGNAASRWSGELLRQALERPTGRPELAVRGVAVSTRGIELLDQALARDPTFVVARMERAVLLHRLGSLLALRGSLAEAAAVYRAAIEQATEVAAADGAAGLREQARDLARVARENLRRVTL